LVECGFFQLDYVRQCEPFLLGGGRMQAVLVLHGSGTLRGDDDLHPLAAGQTLLLPAALKPAWCQPQGTLGLLVATPPETRQAAA
jgi:hypothetical protein